MPTAALSPSILTDKMGRGWWKVRFIWDLLRYHTFTILSRAPEINNLNKGVGKIDYDLLEGVGWAHHSLKLL